MTNNKEKEEQQDDILDEEENEVLRFYINSDIDSWSLNKKIDLLHIILSDIKHSFSPFQEIVEKSQNQEVEVEYKVKDEG